jgi:hypothetical protein
MGSLTDKIKDLTGQTEDEQATKDRLQMLQALAEAKIKSYKSKINMQFQNKAGTDKIEIPGIRPLGFTENYHVAAKEGLSEQVGNHITKVIDDLFSIGGNDQGTKDAVKDGIKDLICIALDSFIGYTEAGESEEKFYFVIPEGHAFVRFDLIVWKYHMESQKIIAESDTAVAYVFCKSVVDHKELKIDELIYLISDLLTKRVSVPFQDKTFTTSDTPPKTVTRRCRLNANGELIILDKSKSDDDPTKFQEWHLGQHPIGGTPPSISDVSTYVEELRKLWKIAEQALEE